MENELVKHTEVIATRLVHGRNDAVDRCLAEQDLRALAVRYFVRAARDGAATALRALIRLVSNALSAQRYGHLHDDNSPALR